MKRYHQRLSLLALFFLASLLASCATRIPQSNEAISATIPPKATEKTPSPSGSLPAGNGLDAPQFRSLPPEARDYLAVLAEAFRKTNKDFLVSQGEAQYEQDLRPLYDEETYLALLYRIGPYSEDSEWKSASLERLEYTQVRAIKYLAWEEKGPMLDIKGRLYFQNGSSLPCRIVLVWRLIEPRILGERP